MSGPSVTGARPALDETQQVAALARARRNATALLGAVAVAFVAASQLPDTTATGYLVAALEAGLVGGLADWFAVVALFRHPLGVPIPHTAVIPRSKDGLGRNLSSFVEGNFLADDQVRERVADPANVDRLSRLLRDRRRADRIVMRGAEVLDAVLATVDEDDLVRRVAGGVSRRLEDLPIARLTGQALEEAIVVGRHEQLVQAVVEGVVDTIARNRSTLRRRLGEESPSWVPPVVDDLVFERGEQVVRSFLLQMAADPEHEFRRALDTQLLTITTQLRTDERTQARVEQTVRDVLSAELLRRWIERWWHDVRALVDDAGHDTRRGASLRETAVEPVVGLGRRLRDDVELRARTVELLEQAAAPVASIGQRELGGLIEATVERWDAQDTSRRLELWLGRDLQFVRINGTLVGAGVGVLLHGVLSLLS